MLTTDELFSEEWTENKLQNVDIAGCFEIHTKEEDLEENKVEMPIGQEKRY